MGVNLGVKVGEHTAGPGDIVCLGLSSESCLQGCGGREVNPHRVGPKHEWGGGSSLVSQKRKGRREGSSRGEVCP